MTMSLDRNKRIPCLLLALALSLPVFACARVNRLISNPPQNALLINEVVTSNQLSLRDEVYGSPDWIELRNGSDQPVHLSSYYITDNVEASQKAFQLPDAVLAPGELYLLYASKQGGPNSMGFSLKKGGETLYLLDAHMEVISSLAVPSLIRDVSYARRANGSYGYCDLPTPGAANEGAILDAIPLSSRLLKEADGAYGNLSPSLPILITEVVSKNEGSLTAEGCEGCTEWVELYNPNNTAVSLAGFTLTDDMTAGNKHNFPESELDPGQYLIVCCGRKACAAEGHVRVDVGLSAQGEELFLFDGVGYTLDHVPFPALEADVSWAKRADGSWGYCMQPTPGAGQRNEDILDNMSPQPMSDPFSTVHIHEVLYRNSRSILDEDGDRSDFVELYNGGEYAVDLKGWYISDSVEKLTKWALPDVTLAPGAFQLVFLSGKDRDRGELHASFSLRAGETVTLFNSVSRQYDAVMIPETEENVSIGRDEDGQIVFYSHPTPLAENGNPLHTGK